MEGRVYKVVCVVYQHEGRVGRKAGDDGVDWGVVAAHGGYVGVLCAGDEYDCQYEFS